ncbi:MAG: hypothetical protein WCF56_13655, partial [Pseudolabrys sp.]
HRMSGCEGNTSLTAARLACGLFLSVARSSKWRHFPAFNVQGRLVWFALSNRNAREAPTLASGLLHVSGARGA